MILLSQVKNAQSIWGLAPHEEDYDAEREDKSLHLYQSLHHHTGGRLLAGCAKGQNESICRLRRQGKQTYGIRRVRRWIQRQTGKLVNGKAILRVMRKLNLLSAVRRRRPYTCYQQAVYRYPHLLDRNFDQVKPNQFWVTDITYIPIPGSMLYMCAVLDLCGKAVLAWKIGADMSSSLVTNTIRLKREKITGGLALHSDQGSQHTSQAYFDLTQAYHVSPSMSSPGQRWRISSAP